MCSSMFFSSVSFYICDHRFSFPMLRDEAVIELLVCDFCKEHISVIFGMARRAIWMITYNDGVYRDKFCRLALPAFPWLVTRLAVAGLHNMLHMQAGRRNIKDSVPLKFGVESRCLVIVTADNASYNDGPLTRWCDEAMALQHYFR